MQYLNIFWPQICPPVPLSWPVHSISTGLSSSLTSLLEWQLVFFKNHGDICQLSSCSVTCDLSTAVPSDTACTCLEQRASITLLTHGGQRNDIVTSQRKPPRHQALLLTLFLSFSLPKTFKRTGPPFHEKPQHGEATVRQFPWDPGDSQRHRRPDGGDERALREASRGQWETVPHENHSHRESIRWELKDKTSSVQGEVEEWDREVVTLLIPGFPT